MQKESSCTCNMPSIVIVRVHCRFSGTVTSTQESVTLLLLYPLSCLGARPLDLLLNRLQHGHHEMTRLKICCGARLFYFESPCILLRLRRGMQEASSCTCNMPSMAVARVHCHFCGTATSMHRASGYSCNIRFLALARVHWIYY